MWAREEGSIADSVQDSGSESERTDSEHERPRKGSRQQCHSRNAILARKNRLKKKRHMEKLENEVARLRLENDALRKESRTQDETARLLRKRTRYLEGVLANSTELRSLLGAVRGCGFPTACSLLARVPPPPPPPQGNPPPQPDHIYSKTQPADEPLWQLQAETLPEDLDVPDESLFDFSLDDEPLFPDAGICLHVAKQRVSLEFCSSCHSNAEQAWADMDV